MKKWLAILMFCVGGTAHAGLTTGFEGPYAQSLWVEDMSVPCTGCSTDISPTSLILVGADGAEAVDQSVARTITVVSDALITFDWSYVTDDPFGPFYDPFGYLLNGAFAQLSDDDGLAVQSDSASVFVEAGDVFGFAVLSLDSLGGAATATINNFRASDIPEPGTLGLLAAAALLGGTVARRRRTA